MVRLILTFSIGKVDELQATGPGTGSVVSSGNIMIGSGGDAAAAALLGSPGSHSSCASDSYDSDNLNETPRPG